MIAEAPLTPCSADSTPDTTPQATPDTPAPVARSGEDPSPSAVVHMTLHPRRTSFTLPERPISLTLSKRKISFTLQQR